MHDLNDALDELRSVIPYAHSPSVRKLSKIATLLLAKNYILMQGNVKRPGIDAAESRTRNCETRIALAVRRIESNRTTIPTRFSSSPFTPADRLKC